MWICLYFLISLTAIAWLPEQLNGSIAFNDQFWIPKEFVFVLLGLTVIALPMFSDKPKKKFHNGWFAAALIFIGLGFCMTFYQPLMFNQPEGKVYWNVWNFRPTVNFIIGFFMIQALIENTDSMSRWVTTAKVLCWTAFLISCYALLQWLGVDPIFKNAHWVQGDKSREIHMVTFFANDFLTTNYVAIISPLCLMFKELRYKIFYAVIFLCVVLSKTMFSIAALIAGLMAYLVLNRKFKSSAVLIGICVLALIVVAKIYPNELADNGRFPLWVKTISSALETAFTGTGIGSYGVMGFKSAHMKAMSAHNEFLQIFQEGGFPLLIITIGYLLTLFKKILYQYLEAPSILLIGFFGSFVSFLVICCGGFPLRIAPLALLAILTIACLEVQTLRR